MATDVPLTQNASTTSAAVLTAGNSSSRWLIWKEIRQLKPLLVLLISLTLGLIVQRVLQKKQKRKLQINECRSLS